MNQPNETNQAAPQRQERCFKPYIERRQGDTVLCRGPVGHEDDCDVHWPVRAHVPSRSVTVRDIRLCVQVNIRATEDPSIDDGAEFRTGWMGCVRDDPDHRRLRHGGMPFMPTLELARGVEVPIPGE